VLFKRTTARYVRCLDESILVPAQVQAGLAQASIGADVVLIDGRNGLYDGVTPGSLRTSDAEIAALTGAPVVLVVDTRGFGSSLTALIRGFGEFAADFTLAGTLLNRVSLSDAPDAPNTDFYATGLQIAGMEPPLGGVPELGPAAAVLPPAGITEQENLTSLPRQFFVDLSHAVSRTIDIERLLACAGGAPEFEVPDDVLRPLSRRTRIAVAEDACFNVCFQDNLDLLRFYGAEIVPFSPLADSEIPRRVGGIYLPGGCLGEYAEELVQNGSMLRSIADFANAGGLIYAEGAGAAYLSREFSIGGTEAVRGVGTLPGVARRSSESFGYIESITAEESILGRSGLIMKGVANGSFSFVPDDRILRVLRSGRLGLTPAMEGYSPGAQIVASFAFHHFGSNPLVARNLVDACEVVQGM
jgi:cobyrinic acid a,c-diamide synthase